MTKLYLITGFLGAGKTTFLHQFVRLFPDRRTAIVVNEFGKQGVDGTLLEDLDIKMEEINNGSIFCACKIEQFEDALLRLQQENFDVIFVDHGQRQHQRHNKLHLQPRQRLHESADRDVPVAAVRGEVITIYVKWTPLTAKAVKGVPFNL